MEQQEHQWQWVDSPTRPSALQDPGGTCWAEATWMEDRLRLLRLRLPGGQWLDIQTAVATHPVFGLCDAVYLAGAKTPLSVFRSVNWSKPRAIPPLERPGILPRGAGSAILNFLAYQAAANGVSSLRYVGPYPTANLFDTLLQSFTVEGEPSVAFARFVADAETSANSAQMCEAAVDFRPAPFVWEESSDGLCIQWRGAIEKLYCDGTSYARDTWGMRRLALLDKGETLAYLDVAGERLVEIARFDAQGVILEGPQAIPAYTSPWIAQALPEPLRDVLVQALLPRAPALLQPALQAVLERVPLRWADTESRLSRTVDGTIEVHAHLAQRLQASEPRVVIDTLLLAVETQAQRLAQTVMEQAWQRQGTKA